MCKTLLSFELLVDADDWPFLGKTKLILYIFCPLLFKKRPRATGVKFADKLFKYLQNIRNIFSNKGVKYLVCFVIKVMHY